MTSVWGVSAVAILLRFFSKLCVWSTKKLTMLAYCVAANCNNSQTTSGITMHELPRNRPAVRQKWMKFIEFKRADFLAAPQHAHLCSEHFNECDFANPMEYRMEFCFEADTMFRYPFKILPDRLKLIRLYPCGSLGQSVSFVLGARIGHFAATPQSDVVGIWSRDLGVMATLSVRQKTHFFRAFITLRSEFHLHHRSQRALTWKSCQKSPLTLDLSFNTVVLAVVDGLCELERWDKLFTCPPPPPPPAPSLLYLISLMASADVKQHVYLLYHPCGDHACRA